MDGSGFVEFPEFCNLMYKKISDADTENELKETFRVFSKDNEGCITAEELKFVLTHLPGKVSENEIFSNFSHYDHLSGYVQRDRRNDQDRGQER